MTLIYVHGVKVRSPDHGIGLEASFQRWLAPRMVPSGKVEYRPVFWGDAAARFRWNLATRPKTKLIKQGQGGFPPVGGLRSLDSVVLSSAAVAPVAGGPVLGGGAAASTPSTPPLNTLPAKDRPDFLADLYLAAAPAARSQDPLAEAPELAAVAVAADEVAGEWEQIIAGSPTDEDRVARLLKSMHGKVGGGLIMAGGFEDWMIKAGEWVKRRGSMPFDGLSVLAGELRPMANEFVANFLGDVLIYLNERLSPAAGPGEIPRRVLDALAEAQAHKVATGEPIIVVSHSMGGQLIYDAVTHFAAADPRLKDLEIDHWISYGAQVGFFAELGLFLGQPVTAPGQKLPLPPHAKRWTNYYDTNDLVGFIMEPVFEGVKDIEYDTGYGLALAHTGFLARPSFFETIAGRIAAK